MRWGVGVAIFVWASSSIAYAARTAVLNEPADLYEKPDKKSTVLDKIVKGEPVVASNIPLQGFYKIRTRNGTIGWILEDALALGPMPSPEEIQQSQEQAPQPSRRTASEDKARDQPEEKAPKTESFRLRILGDLNFFSASGVVTNYVLTQAFSLGGEISMPVFKDFSVVLRMEKLSSSTPLINAANGDTVQINVGGLPIMGGLEYNLLSGPVMTVHVAAFVGYSLQTELQASDLTNSAVVDGVSSGFTALGKVDFTLQVSSLISLFAEAGYRLLQSGQMNIPAGNSAGSILASSFVLNLSGPFVGGGVGFSF